MYVERPGALYVEFVTYKDNYLDLWPSINNSTLFQGGEPGEDTEEFLELQEKLKNPEKMTRWEKFQWCVF